MGPCKMKNRVAADDPETEMQMATCRNTVFLYLVNSFASSKLSYLYTFSPPAIFYPPYPNLVHRGRAPFGQHQELPPSLFSRLKPPLILTIYGSLCSSTVS